MESDKVKERKAVSGDAEVHGIKDTGTGGPEQQSDDVKAAFSHSIRARASGAQALGAMAVGAFALGAFAIGALAVGRLAIGRLTIGRSRLRKLEIDELDVKRIRMSELQITNPQWGIPKITKDEHRGR